jgi:hypothetical protein
MPDTQYTALLFIIDRSGSMSSIRDDMVGGLTTLLEEQKSLPGFLTVDIVQFDNVIENVCEMASPDNLTITLEPRGGTALNDAIGSGVNGFAQRISALPDHAKPHAVQVVVVTDGQENSSTEYTAGQINALVTEKQADPAWDFVFLGANQDAVLAGGRLGFAPDASMTFAPAGAQVHEASAAASRYIRDRRSGSRQGFSPDERRRSTGEEK